MTNESIDRGRALGAFLRAQRERVPPESAEGVGRGRKRRTPGLRREEVALSAGMSAVWYMRIEQGKAAAVSPHALARIAGALRLGPAERAHLFAIAGRHDPALGGNGAPAITGTLRRCVAEFAGPAYLMDGHWTIATANEAAVRLFGDWMRGEGNLLRFTFLDPAARRLIHDWPGRARRLLAEFRLDHGRRIQDPAINRLVDDLRAESPDFATWWGEQQVLEREGGLRLFNHREDGPLAFDQLTLTPTADPSLKLVLLFPGTV